ncbi:hypothetical protein INT45_007800, partial [Circinella minor]
MSNNSSPNNNQQSPVNQSSVNNNNQSQHAHADDTMMGEAPWIPDVQDGLGNINPEELGLNSDPALTARYFQLQIARSTNLLHLATIRGNMDEVQNLAQQHENWKHHLAIIENLLQEQQQLRQPAKAEASSSKNNLVPKDLPAFQLKGQHCHDKRRESYDSAETFLDDFEVYLSAHGLNVEQNWRRLIPLTCDANRRAWLLTTMKKDGITNWSTFRQEVEKYFTSPYTIFYRRHRIRTMKQGKTEPLREYSNKMQEYAFKYGILNNQDLVFNYLCSLNKRYRKQAWSLIANHHGDKIPNHIEPVVQTVQSLVAADTSSEASDWAPSSADDDSSNSDKDSDEEKPSKKRCRKSTNNNNNRNKKNKGKGPAINNKNTCPLHPKSNHRRWECDKLKEVLSPARNNNNNNNFFGNRQNSNNNRGFPGNSSGPYNAAKVNWCHFCRRVPFVMGHQCAEMLRARCANINNNNNNNNNTIRSRMSHVTPQLEDLLEVDDDELMNSSSNNNKGNGQYNSLLQYSTNIKK